MPKCTECGADDWRIIMRRNPIFVYECENGHVFKKEAREGK